MYRKINLNKMNTDVNTNLNQNELQYKNDDPGSVRYGNFINYYQFQPPEKRVEHLLMNIWDHEKGKKQVLLDIGCNAGNLTKVIHDLFTQNVCNDTTTYGVDIDPKLIERAVHDYSQDKLHFKCADVLKDNTVIKEIMTAHNIQHFTTTFCFSVTMWIHINHGDKGLKQFLNYISNLSEILVIEPQPWKCYKSAVKRLRKSKEEFPCFKDLKIRENVEDIIEKYLLNHCNMIKLCESDRTEWSRKLLFFKHA